jgi:hypothetical protein
MGVGTSTGSDAMSAYPFRPEQKEAALEGRGGEGT